MASNNQDNSMTNSTMLKFENALETDERNIELEKGEIKNEKAFFEALAAGDVVKISQLLSSCVLVDTVKYNKLLSSTSEHYMTPLQLAASNGHEDCLDILIDHGADVNAKNRFDVTALHMAAEKGYFVCVKKLLYAGANCHSPTKYSKFGCYTAVPYLRGTTPLHLAAANNHADCCKVLIDYGAKYNAIDEDGRTSMFIAAQKGFSACVLIQLRHEVCWNILSLPDFRTKNTPLHFAVFHEMLDCVHELLKLGSDVNHINALGYSPLHIAVMTLDNGMSRSNVFSEMLIREGYNTDINLPDSRHYTPLHYVCFDNHRWRRQPQLATFLIVYGANINISNIFGSTLLQSELDSPEANYDILTYMVRSMLYLPRLEDFYANQLYTVSDIRNLGVDGYSAILFNLNDGDYPSFIEKCLWYDQMASSPRSLKHCCRFAIRKAMGCRRLKHVKKLPIPPLLQSYIQLQRD